MKKIILIFALFFVFSFKVNALQYSLWVKDTTAPKIDDTYFGSRDLNSNSVEYQINDWIGTYPQKTDYVYLSVMLSSKNNDLSMQDQEAYYINYSRTFTVYLKHRYAGKVACQRLTSNGYGSFDTFKCPSFVNNNEDKVIAVGFEHPITINPTPVQVFVFNKYFTFEIDENLVESKEQTKVLNDIHKNLTDQLEQANQNSQKQVDAINKQTEATKEQTDYIKDDTAPETDISVLGNVSGILPPGPLDSLLNIPFKFLSVLTSSFSGTCVPMKTTWVFNESLTIPCFSEIFYQKVPAILMTFIDLVPATFLLIKYFKHLYKKIDRAVSMESNSDDEWGVI